MRASLALLLVLVLALMSGCQGGTSEETAKIGAATESTDKVAEKVGEPVVITPDPGAIEATIPDAGAESVIDASDGVSEKEAQVVGAYYLRALRQERLGAGYGDTSEAFSMLNQVRVMSEWLLTYSRTTIDGEPADAYAATIVVDSNTGKQLRFTEAP